jgi:phospholipid-binding lipoprotein MlaA
MKLPHLPARRMLGASMFAAALAALGGCAAVAHPSPNDPLEPFNRSMYRFNEDLDRVVLKPTATWYRERVPPLMRTGVSNFFNNLGDAWSAVNSLMQFHLQDFEENLARFHMNTMFGVFGIFDVASEANIERHREDFGQTLGRWGVPAGPFLVLPFFGPSTLRDAVALPVDWHYDLVQQITPVTVRSTTYGVRLVNARANLLRAGDMLDEAALDKYSFTRDAYLQRRQAEVFDHENDREETPPPLPDESAEPPAAAPAAPGGQPPAQPAR